MKSIYFTIALALSTVGVNAAQFFTGDFNNGTAPAEVELTSGFTRAYTGSLSDYVSFAGSSAACEDLTEYRQYLRTIDSDYSAVDFRFEATIIRTSGTTAWGRIFYGLGVGTVRTDFFGEPGRPVIGCVAEENSVARFYEMINDSTENGDGHLPVGSAAFAGPGTHRLRMDWNITNQLATFSIDQNYAGGTFAGDFSFDVDATRSLLPFPGSSSYLYIGGGEGVVVDDISVTAIPGPAVPVESIPVEFI